MTRLASSSSSGGNLYKLTVTAFCCEQKDEISKEFNRALHRQWLLIAIWFTN